jgi:hypothetical protein
MPTGTGKDHLDSLVRKPRLSCWNVENQVTTLCLTFDGEGSALEALCPHQH